MAVRPSNGKKEMRFCRVSEGNFFKSPCLENEPLALKFIHNPLQYRFYSTGAYTYLGRYFAGGIFLENQ